MRVLEFSYKNILSYGNRLQIFEFEDRPQLILVEGENGAGKSSIKEALTVAIYGRSAIRKMKDIPNWINKNAYTNVKFVTNTGEIVEIDRGIDPNFSNIKINEVHFNLPDKRKVDEFIEDELARIPFPVFCNTISLSFDDFKSFVNLSQADKRKIVDRIFGIDILSDMRVKVKDDLRQSKKELEIVQSKIERGLSSLKSSQDQLEKLKEKLLKKKGDESENLKSQLEEKEKDREEIKKKYASFKSSIDSAQKQIEQIRDENSKVKASIQDLGEKLRLYQKNRCPHCLNDLTTDSSLKTKEVIENKKQLLESRLPDLKSSFERVNSDLQSILSEQNTTKSKFYRIEAEINQLSAQLQRALSEVVSDETDSIRSIILSIQSELKNDEEIVSEKKSQVDLFSTLDDLLSDSGIKKTLIDKIVPTLNLRIHEISQRLEFKFSFEFDGDFNPVISYLGMEISPESLSSGQRKKMNLIVLLAFIEIIKMKHSTMNVMFLDEIFSSLDKNNVYRAIEILKEYSVRHKMTIFVVSHEALPEEFFSSKIRVVSNNHFSEMEVVRVSKS